MTSGEHQVMLLYILMLITNPVAPFYCIPYVHHFVTDENPQFFQDLKSLVEETYVLNGNHAVVLLAHSMGGPMSLQFLHLQKQSWKDKYIRALVTLSGVWGGSVKAMKVYTIGKDHKHTF